MNLFHWKIVHVPGRYSSNHMKLIEGVEWNGERLQIGNLDSDRWVGRHIANLQVEDVSTVLVKIPIGDISAFLYGCFVFHLCLFLFFDNSLDSCFPKLCDKFVDACTGVNGKTILHFQEYISGVAIYLSEVDIDDGIDYFKMIVCHFERDKGKLIKSIVIQFWVEGITPTFFEAAVGNWLFNKIKIF